jgi:hypothetical protein
LGGKILAQILGGDGAGGLSIKARPREASAVMDAPTGQGTVA